jgi:FkbM family methyltransferase
MGKEFRASRGSRLFTASIEFLLRKLTSRILPVGSEEWRYVQCSFSQWGEDLLVQAALENAGKTGPAWYVDVGAYDPVVYSNTLRLSRAGWKGINIDPNPQTIKKFRALRPRDTNLEMAVAATSGRSDFSLYAKASDPTGRLVTPGGSRESLMGAAPERTIEVETAPLAAILDRYLPEGALFGFLNVDCEGFDLEVLKSNDWPRHRPWVIAVEDHTRARGSEIESFCVGQRYQLFAQSSVTKIFLRQE